ncbi:MAG: hypothetical protein U0230_24250 [Polyangiales bacterium]
MANIASRTRPTARLSLAVAAAIVVSSLVCGPARADGPVVALALDVGAPSTVRTSTYVTRDYPSSKEVQSNSAHSAGGALRLFLGRPVRPHLSVGATFRVGFLQATVDPFVDTRTTFWTFDAGPGLRVGPQADRRGFYGDAHGGFAMGVDANIGFAAGLDVGYQFPVGRAGVLALAVGFLFQKTYSNSEGDFGDYHFENRILTPSFSIEFLPMPTQARASRGGAAPSPTPASPGP